MTVMRPEIEADYRAAAGELISRMEIIWELWSQTSLPIGLLNQTLLLQLVKSGEDYAAEKLRWREQQEQPSERSAPPQQQQQQQLSAEQLEALQAAAAARQQQANQWLENRERSGGAPW